MKKLHYLFCISTAVNIFMIWVDKSAILPISKYMFLYALDNLINDYNLPEILSYFATDEVVKYIMKGGSLIQLRGFTTLSISAVVVLHSYIFTYIFTTSMQIVIILGAFKSFAGTLNQLLLLRLGFV